MRPSQCRMNCPIWDLPCKIPQTLATVPKLPLKICAMQPKYSSSTFRLGRPVGRNWLSCPMPLMLSFPILPLPIKPCPNYNLLLIGRIPKWNSFSTLPKLLPAWRLCLCAPYLHKKSATKQVDKIVKVRQENIGVMMKGSGYRDLQSVINALSSWSVLFGKWASGPRSFGRPAWSNHNHRGFQVIMSVTSSKEYSNVQACRIGMSFWKRSWSFETF